jgi:hypothetical protein
MSILPDPIRRVFSKQYVSASANKHSQQTKLMMQYSIERILFGIFSLQNSETLHKTEMEGENEEF